METPLSSVNWRDILDWDIENWSHAPLFWLKNTRLDLSKSRALEIGAHNGGPSLFLALHGSEVVCSDVNGPTEQAKNLHKRYGISNRISYANVNAIEINFPDNSFDIVIFKSVMGAMGSYTNQEKMIKEIRRVLKPNGELWFAENLKGSILHSATREFYRGNTWRYLTIEEINSLCEPFSSKILQQYGFLAVFGRIEILQIILGKIDQILDSIIPSRWKYIVFGIARK